MKLRIAFVTVAALALSACPSPVDPAARITLSTSTAAFDALAGNDPTPRTVAIANGGGGSLTGLQVRVAYANGQPSGWLTATLSATAAPATLSIQASSAALAPGSYSATVSVSSTRLIDETVTLPVTLNLTAGGVIAGLATASAQFALTQGLPDPTASFDITNTGAGALRGLAASVSYAAGGATDWLTATLSATTAPATLELRVASGALAPGSHAATVVVTSPYATNGAQTIPVTLNLAAGAVDLVVTTPDTLILPASIQAGQQLDLPAWTVMNVGTVPSPSVRIGVYLSTDADFTGSDVQLVGIQTLPLPPGGSRVTGARTVGIPTALAAGEYWIGIVADLNSEAAESDETNNVKRSKILVTAAPAIATQPEAVSFDVFAGDGLSAAQTVAITNSGGGTLDQLALGISADWLRASLPQTTAPATLSLVVDASALTPGTQTAQVMISSPVSSNAKVIEVTVHVTAGPTIDLDPAALAYTVTAGASNPEDRLIAISNSGGGTLEQLRIESINYGVGQPITGWLAAELDRTTAPATLIVHATTANLPARQPYSASIIVSSPVAPNGSRAVSVTVNVQPALAAAPGSLGFNGSIGGSDPQPQIVNVTSYDHVPFGAVTHAISYAAGEPTGWLSAAADGEETPVQLTVQPSLHVLPAAGGTFHATITVSSVFAGNSPVQVPVQFTVTAASDLLVTVPAELDVDTVTFQPGRAFRVPPWTVVNQGEGVTAPYHVGVYLSSDPTFTRDDIQLDLVAAPAMGRNGFVQGGGLPVTVPPGTPAGTYWIGIVADPLDETIETDEVNNWVASSVSVLPAPIIVLDHDSLGFERVAGDLGAAPQHIAITTGGGPLDGLGWSLDAPDGQSYGWLAGGLFNGQTAPTTLDVALHISSDTLPPGLYVASLTVSSYTTNVSKTIPVTLRIRPALAFSQRFLTFTATAGGASPAAQSVTVLGVNGPVEQLSVTASDLNGAPAPWLTATLGAAVTPANLEITVNPAGLVPATYTGRVRVSAPDAANSPFDAFVTFHVVAQPTMSVAANAVALQALAGAAIPVIAHVAVASGSGTPISNLAASVSYAAGQPTGWLTAGLTAASTPAYLDLTGSATALTGGTYNATVTVSGDAVNSPQTVAVTFTVAPLVPDLVVTGVGGAPLSVTPASVVQLGVATINPFTIRNTGNAFSGAFDVGVYLSTDATMTAGDLRLSGLVHSGLSGGSSEERAAIPVTIPLSVPAGTYYIGVLLDGPGTVAEANENNNAAIASLGVFPGTAPNAPSSASVTNVSGTSIDLRWIDNSSNEDGFRIQRCSEPGAISCSGFPGTSGTYLSYATAPAGATSFRATGLTVGVSYVYRIAAYNAFGASAFISVAGAPAPATPSNLTATAQSVSQITLSWTDNETVETNYQVERCVVSACGYTLIATLGANAASFADAGLGEATAYQYRVRAMAGTSAGAYSNLASATTRTASSAPTAPTALTATAINGNRIDLGWIDNSNFESGFTLERCTAITCINGPVPVATIAANTTAYSDTGLAGATTYRYRLRAFNSVGTSTYTTIVSATTLPVPVAPSGLVATAVTSRLIRLNWVDNSTNETGFRIERCSGVSCTALTALATTAASATLYSDDDVSVNSTYRYRVQAFNANGNSAFTGVVAATTPTLEAPSNLVLTVNSSGRISLTWTNNAPVIATSQVEIQRCTGAGCTSFTQLTTLQSPAASYVNTTLTPSTSYSYRIRARQATYTSAFTPIVTGVTLGAPAAPTNLTAILPTTTSITFNWIDHAVTGTRLQVERCSGVGCTNFVTLSVGTLLSAAESYTNGGLASATTYQYRVRTTDGDNASAYSNVVSATTQPAAGAPAAPSGLSATAVSSAQVNLTWTDNATNETGYQLERCSGAGCVNFAVLVNASVANVTSYQNSGLAPLTSYRYRVRMFNAAGNSLYSNTVTVMTP